MPQNLTQEDHDFLVESLRSGEISDPAQQDRAMDLIENYRFLQQNVDYSTPNVTADKQRAIRRNISPYGFARDNTPVTSEGSREAVLRQVEKQGVDTTTGFGDFGEVFGAAKEFNSPTARATYMDGIVRRNLEEAGIEVPKSLQVVDVHPDLEEMMFLRPTEDGKLKWTLAEAEFFRPQDVAAIADLPSTLSAVGAGAAAMLPVKHPLLTEFAGDYLGRQAGNALEYLWASGEVSNEEVQSVFGGQALMESALETGISRATGRVVDFAKTRGKSRITERDPDRASELDASIQETADTLEALQQLTSREFNITRREASNRDIDIQEQAAQESKLKSANRATLERIRTDNVRALAEANDAIARNHSTTDLPAYEPYTVARQARDSVIRLRNEYGTVAAPEVEHFRGGRVARYFYKDSKAPTSANAKPQAGVTVVFDDDAGVAMIDNIADAPNFRGGMPALFEEAFKDSAMGDYALVSGRQLSREADAMMQRLSDKGWQVTKNPNAVLEDGVWKVPDGSPVYTVDAAPGEVLAKGDVATAEFDRRKVEGTLEDLESLLPAAEQMSNEANSLLRGAIKWSEQRQTSGYALDNPRTSSLRAHLRRIQNRVDNALTGAEASEADRKLAALIRKEEGEEGETILSGLAGEELDIGNFLTARDKVLEIAERTGDQDMARVATTMDNMLRRGNIYTNKGNLVADSTRANINARVDDARRAQERVVSTASEINANVMFKKNANGEYVNTTPKDFDTLLASGSRFMKHLKPLIESNPAIKLEAINAINEQYRKRVLDKGWTRAKHETFMARYSNAMDAVMSPEQVRLLQEFPLQNRRSAWDSEVARSRSIVQRQIDRLGMSKNDPTNVNPENIIGSLSKMGRAGAEIFMRDLNRSDPRLAAALRETSIEQTRRFLHETFFNVDKGVSRLKMADDLRMWLGDNKETLRAVHGEMYVRDLQTVVNAHLLDARRRRIPGFTPETQGDVIRVTRSLLGPLSKPQRQITAGNMVRQRFLANKILEVYSDPAKLRELRSAKGISPLSRAGIAVLSRMGIWEAAGLAEDDPQFLPKAREFLEQIQIWEAEGNENLESAQ